MTLTRRDFVAGAALSTVMAAHPHGLSAKEETTLYGLIAKIDAVEGKRDELASILVEGVAGMPGCLSYVVAKDGTDPDALWVTEVWKDAESHRASLALESVQQAIAKGRPLIAGFSERHETEPVGGHGLGG